MNGPYYVSYKTDYSRFIASLIHHSVTKNKEVIDFHVLENAGEYLGEYTPVFTQSKNINKIGPVTENRYFVNKITEDGEVNQDTVSLTELKDTYPNFRFVRIWWSAEEVYEMYHSIFCKKGMHSFSEAATQNAFIIEDFWKLYTSETTVNKNPNLRSDLSSFFELTEDEIKELISIKIKNLTVTPEKDLETWENYQTMYPNNIFIIPFNDIINDMESVLKTIETITEKPRTDELVESYKNYIAYHNSLA
jgi:hypothetical protein